MNSTHGIFPARSPRHFAHGTKTGHTMEPMPRWATRRTQRRPAIYWWTMKPSGLWKRFMLLLSRVLGLPGLPTYSPPNRCLLPDGSTSSGTAPLPTSTRASRRADGMNRPFHRCAKSYGMKRTSGIASTTNKPLYHSRARSESTSPRMNGGPWKTPMRP